MRTRADDVISLVPSFFKISVEYIGRARALCRYFERNRAKTSPRRRRVLKKKKKKRIRGRIVVGACMFVLRCRIAARKSGIVSITVKSSSLIVDGLSFFFRRCFAPFLSPPFPAFPLRRRFTREFTALAFTPALTASTGRSGAKSRDIYDPVAPREGERLQRSPSRQCVARVYTVPPDGRYARYVIR